MTALGAQVRRISARRPGAHPTARAHLRGSVAEPAASSEGAAGRSKTVCSHQPEEHGQGEVHEQEVAVEQSLVPHEGHEIEEPGEGRLAPQGGEQPEGAHRVPDPPGPGLGPLSGNGATTGW